jgi:hypothetical protein
VNADALMPDGPWVDCSWCEGTIPLSRFGVTEEEPGARVAVCGSCQKRVFITPPVHPTGG